VRATLLLVPLVATVLPVSAETVPRLRGMSSNETRIIDDVLARSETARTLVRELESSDVIAYVQLAAGELSGRAATRFVTATADFRFLRVVIGARTTRADISMLLVHELQHVVEIARSPEVRDNGGLRKLYQRIGENRNAQFEFETTAAREVTLRARRELAGSPRVVQVAIGGLTSEPPIAANADDCDQMARVTAPHPARDQ
jgi:hypothetical protein